MGTMHSIPISSAICASRRLFSQLASQRSGSVAYVLPLEQLAPKSPSLRPLPFTRTALRCRIRAFPPRRSTSRTPRRRKDSPFTRCLRGRRLDCIRFRFHPASETRAISSICLARPNSLGYVQHARTKGGPPGHGQCRPSIEPLLLISHSFGVIRARFRTSRRRSRPDRRAQATTARPRPRSHPRQTLSRRIEKAYVAWIRSYIFSHDKRHRADMGARSHALSELFATHGVSSLWRRAQAPRVLPPPRPGRGLRDEPDR